MNRNTKIRVIIGFYLRALRICSPKHLNDEFNHKGKPFLNLLYRKFFIHFAKFKALKIHDKSQPRTNANIPSYKTPPHTFITLPYNSNNIIINNLKLDIKTMSLPSKTICDLINSSPQRNIVSDASVYCILYRNCKLKYIGETSRNLHARSKEHKRDIRVGTLNDTLLQHISQSDHNFDFSSTQMLIYILNKR